MLQRLTEWLKALMTKAENDEAFLISWFKDTEDDPLSIVGGWCDGFSKEYDDLLHISKTSPSFAMCVKIAVNEGSYAYTDFELLHMPLDKKTGEVDDTCIALQKDDNPEELARFLITELERMARDY